MKKFGILLLLALGAGTVAWLWRSQQARDKAATVFDTVTNSLHDASAALPTSSQSSSSDNAKQSQRSTPATTTMLSQTDPDAGASMSSNTASNSATDTALNTASSAAADHSAGTVRGTAATLASDESSFAQPVVRSLDEQADSTSSQADEHYATVENVIESSHQPDSMEVNESDEQTHSAADEAAAQRVSPQSDSEMTAAASQPARVNDTPSITMGNDPDAGQLMADGQDRTITDRIRSRLGQELDHKEWGHLNINTQSIGDVYLRGYVASEELRSRIEQLVSDTEGVQSVVNELNVEEKNEAS